MSDWPTAAMAAVVALLGAALSLAARPVIGFLLPGAAAGTFVGTLIAYQRRLPDPDDDTSRGSPAGACSV